MKTLLISVFALIINSFVGFSQMNPQSFYENSYFRSHGTFIQDYYRTSYNNTTNGDYSTSPNIEKAVTSEPVLPIYTSPNYYSIPTYSTPTISAPSYSPLYSSPSYSSPTYYSTTPIIFSP